MPAERPARYGQVQPDRHWMERGACLKRTDLPWTLDRPGPQERAQMAALCGSCPVLGECRDFAIHARVTAGFWAGASCGWPLQRTSITESAKPSGPQLRDVGGAA